MKKYYRSRQLLFWIAMVFASGAFAQVKVSGTVTDATGTLVGVTIVEKGTTNGVTTDLEGRYALEVSEGASLVFSYVGYISQEITIGSRSVIDVELLEDIQALQEIVVVGYGTTKRPELTGSVATIKKDDIVNVLASNPTTSLQGRLVGVQVESFGGQPGGTANVFIRGVNSLSNASPLYVVDGLFVDNMNWVNPNDIENISVLKDAAASAIYGARAANGVILINTNHGESSNKPRITITSRLGVDTPSKKLDYINGQQFTDYLNQRFENDGESTRLNWNNVNTDWQDENFQTGMVSDLGIAISGGGEKTTYYVSGNHFYQDGILVGSGFERINFRANTRSELGKLTITESIGIAEGKLQENNWFGWDGTAAPTLARRNSANEGGFEAPNQPIHGPGGINHFGLASLEDNETINRTIFGTSKIDYAATDWLTASINFGIDYMNTSVSSFTPTYFMSNVDAVLNVNQQSDLTEFSQNELNTLFEATLNFEEDFGEHKIGALAGYTFFRETQRNHGIFGQGTPSNRIRSVSSLTPSDQLILIGENNEAALESYFGRFNYGYAGKYLFSATVRRDASSRFADDNQTGVFPSFSAGWNISDEAFWSVPSINYFKIRASYGELGSYPETFYPTEAVFLANQSNTSFGGSSATGLAQTTLADPSLIWETTQTVDIGVDMAFLENRVQLTIDYFSKDIQDVLVDINVPSTSGVSLPVTRNAGSLENKGLEFDASYRKQEGDFQYTINGNVSFNLVSRAGEIPNTILGPGIDEDLRIVNRTATDQPIGFYYGYIVEDKVNPATGDFVRKDINRDGEITDADQTIIGDPNPDFTYGINFAAKYKNWDFGLNFNGVQGSEIYNLARYYSILWQDGGKLTDVLDSWTPSNTDTSIPRASIADPAGNKAPSSFFVEDGSYFRLKNLDIAYTFKDALSGIDWIQDLRLSLNIQNVFVITGYSGYDPDVASTNGGRANRNTGVPGLRPAVNPLLGRGLDARAYPNARTFMFGIQATF